MVAPDRGERDRTRIYRETIERFWVLRLVIEVRHDGVYLRLGPIQRSFRYIPLQNIDEVQVTTYSSTTYAGWHWGLRKTPGGNTVYRLRGDHGVELTLTDGTRIFIGTEHPTELETAITHAFESAIPQE
ncbi:DUF6141 family protein [Natrinema sp. SYSU A 869]|uniref:DUF6141 family protein n=1 Tax=Natrinema sp. SYSU A 869 TaxID=2871694 RepID=UPI001CA3A3BE|nr:DUF6141 family protein [Natrinema sp. SYSU A 869]